MASILATDATIDDTISIIIDSIDIGVVASVVAFRRVIREDLHELLGNQQTPAEIHLAQVNEQHWWLGHLRWSLSQLGIDLLHRKSQLHA